MIRVLLNAFRSKRWLYLCILSTLQSSWQRPYPILAPHAAAFGGGVRGENMACGPPLAG
jgi:hypothetical protein